MVPRRHGADADGHLCNALRQASAKSVLQSAACWIKFGKKNKDCRTPSWRMLPSAIGGAGWLLWRNCHTPSYTLEGDHYLVQNEALITEDKSNDAH